jgi:hypothetical protein
MEGITLPELAVVLVWIVSATVFSIQKLKAILHKKPVPSWVWLAASVVVPFGLVVLVCQQWAQDIINPMLPDTMRLDLEPSAALPTALTAVIGSNGAYATAKRLGLVKDYSQNGTNNTQNGNVAQYVEQDKTYPAETVSPSAKEVLIPDAAINDAAPGVNKAMLLQRLYYPGDGPERYVNIGGKLYPIDNG